MKKSDWKNTAELIGIAAIVASLVFVGMQLMQENDIALVGTTQSWVETSTDLNIAISESAEIWAKSNSGEELSEEERIAIKQLVIGLYRRAVANTFQRRRLGESGSYTLQSFAIQLYENPGAAQIWMEMTEDELKYLEQLGDKTGAGLRETRKQVISYLDTLKRQNKNGLCAPRPMLNGRFWPKVATCLD